MSALKNVVEPGSIVLAFTAGALINRRRSIRASDSELHAPLLPRRAASPDNARFRNNITSRFLAKFPFLIEIWYWNLTYWVYQLARALTATIIRNNEAVFARAEAHALAILSFEKRLHFAIELPIQKYILNHMPWLMPILAKIYYSHITVGVIFLVYIYTYLPPPLFRTIRRTIAANNFLAFLILTLYRCSPPRLLPPSYGFTDILHPPSGDSGSAWTHNRFQLTIAAMPSLHFGTALFLAVCTTRFAPHRVLRVLAPLWPAAMLLTVLATANHFVCDAVVGALIPAVGWRVNRWVCAIGAPVEEVGLWACRTEKPAPAPWGWERRRVGAGREEEGGEDEEEAWKDGEGEA
ncbi:hypothetical protein DIS24_g9303 [Lasiodiplodia hormozganensis]|uniref:Inositolphosphotransferase Aur1/Ipt1 domain-containing protein n=1 Tax=Lasiodiplodia hormozganensis TaxID=869390 RepID=A0AA40CKL3_9PEZI|nr:hypothetical protein DIS24_g9303 [Lasiodiplodia hormozganensis]